MIRNVTDGTEVHRPCRNNLCLLTACGLGPLNADEWTFTNDEVTCEECKQ